ncbi:two-component system sensor histidine kinase DesK [Citricoccus muralis]|uniref:Two-component system sensor histidine kinase DesK n=1 Tax=Citricoccus muralis TaxID=169134 RepID=A0A3D9LBK1_9MICC|nr:two-component system sensor histidine kinase DesK [Citricoccus muralis]
MPERCEGSEGPDVPERCEGSEGSADGIAVQPAGAFGAGEWPEVPLKANERAPVLITAGVWLVFLVVPLVAMVTGDAPLGTKVLGCAGLAAFVVVYMGHFIWPWPWRTLPHWVNTAAATAVLLLCVLATIPAGGLNSFNFLPFTLAIWIFPHRLRVGLPVSVALSTAWVVVALSVDSGGSRFWLVVPTVMALVIMLALRLAMEREERSRILGEELALSRQRERFGRDVHDVLGHSLTVITLKTELARRLVDSDPEQAKVELDEVLELSRQSLAEVRTTVGGLHVPDLGAQLASARTALQAAGIAFDLPEASSVARFRPERRELFAWCLREAITNVIRHSGASHCTVTITADRLTVADDGAGLSEPASPGNGLSGMRHRVTDVGGSLSLSQVHPGSDRPGTTLEVHL